MRRFNLLYFLMTAMLCPQIVFSQIDESSSTLSDNLVTIPHGKSIIVDGIISPNEWNDADSAFAKSDLNDYELRIYFKHDDENFLFLMKDAQFHDNVLLI